MKKIIHLLLPLIIVFGQDNQSNVEIILESADIGQHSKSIEILRAFETSKDFGVLPDSQIIQSVGESIFSNGKSIKISITIEDKVFAKYGENPTWDLLEFSKGGLQYITGEFAPYFLNDTSLDVEKIYVWEPSPTTFSFILYAPGDHLIGELDSSLVGVNIVNQSLTYDNPNNIKIGVDLNGNRYFDSGEFYKMDKPFSLKGIRYIFSGLEKIGIHYKMTLAVLETIEFLSKGFFHPPLTIQSLEDSSTKDLNDFKGEIVVVNWWAINCAPCLAEMPQLNELTQELPHITFIALNYMDEPKEIISFLKTTEFHYDQYSTDKIDSETLGVRSFPRNVILDQNQEVVYDISGFGPGTDLKTEI